MTPVLIIVMGVSGSGKSTIAQALSDKYAFTFLDADDFHDDESKRMMADGIPLTDKERLPWIGRICEELTQRFQNQQSCVLAYSGLRRDHRHAFRELGFKTRFVHLHLSKSALSERLTARKEHFFNPKLLDDQLANMQPPHKEPDLLRINGEAAIAEVIINCEYIVNEANNAIE